MKILGDTSIEGDLDLNSNDINNQGNASSGGGNSGFTSTIQSASFQILATTPRVIISTAAAATAYDLPDNATEGVLEGHHIRVLNIATGTVTVQTPNANKTVANGEMVDFWYSLTGGNQNGPRWIYYDLSNDSNGSVSELNFGSS